MALYECLDLLTMGLIKKKTPLVFISKKKIVEEMYKLRTYSRTAK